MSGIFSEKDIRYAFKELPAKEKDTKGNGSISQDRRERRVISENVTRIQRNNQERS